MNKELQTIDKANTWWKKRMLSRIVAVQIGVLSAVIFLLGKC